MAICVDETAQSAMVCEAVLEHRERGVALRDQAVLFRTGHHSDGLELELARRNIPFVKFGGLKFLESAHVKDLLALVRILENPSDELAWHRVLGLIDGVGPATTRRLVDELGVAEALSDAVRPPLPDHGDGAPDRPRPPPDHGRRLHQPQPLPGRAHPGPTVETGDLAGPPHLDDDYLVLSTIHSAKGGEWRVVHVIHASDGNIPSDMALSSPEEVEEERRLLYVALTRARDTLVVSYPLRYYFRRNPLDDAHLRPAQLAPAASTFDTVSVGEVVVAADPVAAELSALWG